MEQLTHRMGPFLDPHLLLPLLDHCLSVSSATETLQMTRLRLLSTATRMVDFTASEHLLVTGQEDPSYATARETTIAQFMALDTATGPLLSLLKTSAPSIQLTTDVEKNLVLLRQCPSFSEALIDSLYDFALLDFSTGQYPSAAEKLSLFLVLSTDKRKILSALWGKLAADILTDSMDVATQGLWKIIDSLESSAMSVALTQPQLLLQRAWVLHWSLFVFLASPKAPDTDKDTDKDTEAKKRESLVDLFLRPAYLNTLQLVSPWLLRYLCAAVVTSSRRSSLKDLAKALLSSSAYPVSASGTLEKLSTDPIIALCESLFCRLDVMESKSLVSEANAACQSDFFLKHLAPAFTTSIKQYMFETTCKVFQNVPYSHLMDVLSLQNKEDLEDFVQEFIKKGKNSSDVALERGSLTVVWTPRRRGATGATGDYKDLIEHRISRIKERSTGLLSSGVAIVQSRA